MKGDVTSKKENKMENNPAPHSQSGWNEYSRLVLKELETLSTGIVNLNSEIQEIKREIALIKDREDKVEVLRVWKGKMEDIVSPTQLKELIDEVHDLRNFKTRAVTVFVIIQLVIAVLQIFRDKIFH